MKTHPISSPAPAALPRLTFSAPYVHDENGDRFLAVCADKAAHLGPLFAAAPDLLAALEWAVIALRDVPDSHGINRAAICEQARAAIAAATGGSENESGKGGSAR